MKKSNGFTLIEFLIILSILGIIAAVAIPLYNDYVRCSQDKACSAAKKMQRESTPSSSEAAAHQRRADATDRTVRYVKDLRTTPNLCFAYLTYREGLTQISCEGIPSELLIVIGEGR